MTAKFTDYGKQKVFTGWNESTTWGPDRIRLFVNDITPTHDTVTGDFVEASFGGYASGDISGSGTISENGSDEATLTFPTFTNTATGSGLPQSVYGYYVTDVGGALLWAERDPTGPIVIAAVDDEVTVDAVVTLTNVSPP